jgi:bilin biosynthesis protein
MKETFTSNVEGLVAQSPTISQPELRLGVAELLSSGVDSRESLVQTLESGDTSDSATLAGCWLLGRLGYKDAPGVLSTYLADEDPKLCWEAAKSLVLIGDPQTLPLLKEMLIGGEISHSRAAAAYVLGMMKCREAVSLLLDVLTSQDEPEVRSHAAEALGYIADRGATQILITALDDSSAEVRRWSIFALGEIGDNLAKPKLEEIVSSANSGQDLMRDEAIEALSKMK